MTAVPPGRSDEAIVLDLRGLICPDPLLRVIEAFTAAQPNQRVVAEVNFSPAVLTLTSLVQRRPWDVLIEGIADGEWRLTFSRRSGVVAD